MPVERTNKEHRCEYPNCGKEFQRVYDLDRHEMTHCTYEQRKYACSFVGCGFRANQYGGVKCHIRSVHEKVKVPCDVPGCTKMFSDPSSRAKHKQNLHRGTTAERSTRRTRGRSQPSKREDVLDPFIFTFQASSSTPRTPLYDPPSNFVTQLPAPHGGPSAPSTYGANYTIQPPASELPGVSHRANDVQTDSWSLDNNQNLHQANDANPGAALTPSGYHPDVPILSRSQVPTLDHPVQPSHSRTAGQRDLDPSQTSRDQCRCWDCVGGPLTLAPLRGQHREDQGRGEGSVPNEAPFPFSHPRMGHVPPSDHQRSLLPNLPSSAYLQTNPRMLFDHFR